MSEVLEVFRSLDMKWPRLSWLQEYAGMFIFVLLMFKLAAHGQIQQDMPRTRVSDTTTAQVKQRGDHNGQPQRDRSSDAGGLPCDGERRVAPQTGSSQEFSEGLAPVQVDGKFGYIRKDGCFAIAPKYYMALPFREGVAWVVTQKPLRPLGKGEYGVALFGEVTFVDLSGKEVRRPFSAEQVGNFSEGLAAVRPGNIFGGCSKQIGYMNVKGDWAIRPQFDDAHDFSNGLAAVNRGGKCHMGGKWGYIDRDGVVQIPFRFDYAGEFTNGRACVKDGKDWRLIDVEGTGISVTKSQCLARTSDSTSHGI